MRIGTMGLAVLLAAAVSMPVSAAEELKPKCAGMQEGAKCWIELANKPGCYIFDPYYNPPETTTWSGACAGGVAVGRGTWRLKRSDDSAEGMGTLVRGKRHGRWVFRNAAGNDSEGPYVNGKLHGRWVVRFANGLVEEGPYVEGKRHGRWVFRHNGICLVLLFNHGERGPISKC